ncbi:MAG: aminoacyl-tRNA hydrolase [Ignavibacteria bacterium]|nr:aminoacyl-tRNA hydrolase [Ignavibacteria bacterium]
MYLITGLGNPGIRYSLTRHNAGFIILDNLSAKLGVSFTSENILWKGCRAWISDKEVYLMKPMTYMNKSGEAVNNFIHEFRSLNNKELSGLLVITDDFNLPLGTVRLRPGGSDGGHNGLKSIINCLGTDEFPRMRVGIGSEKLGETDDPSDFVLGNFTDEEFAVFNSLMPVYIDCIIDFLTNGIEHAMNTFNRFHLDIDKIN